MPAWEAHDPTLTRPIAAPLERCAELLGVDLTAIQEAAAYVEPYLRVDGTKVWSLMQLERSGALTPSSCWPSGKPASRTRRVGPPGSPRVPETRSGSP
jgi:hypothetical protein